MLAICNASPVHISVAIMFYSPETCSGEGGNFETMGWWSLPSGSCARVYANDLEDVNRYWFYYAHGDGWEWAGPYQTTVSSKVFNGCWGIGHNGEPYRTVGFRLLDIGNNDDFTLTLQ